jgi:uncharacterized membrane protein
MTNAKAMNQSLSSASRVQSIDLVRGFVMVLMALDHSRHFFHFSLTSALDFDASSPALFFTRWITHFCAPAFVLLAGTAACLYGKKYSMKELSVFLLTRGLWLMILELTVIRVCWNATPFFPVISLQVIWAIGMCMVFMSFLVYLPSPFILALGICIIAGHNMLDRYNHMADTVSGFLWSMTHVRHSFALPGARTIKVVYPFLPWLGVMMLGYCLGLLYDSGVKAQKRKIILIISGALCCVLFMVLRFMNIYGDPHHFTVQSSLLYSIFDFVNTRKYPPSLLYLLMTLGPVLIVLSIAENFKNSFFSALVTIGKVPLFFYIGHLFIIHALLLITFFATGHSWHELEFMKSSEVPSTFGFNLAVVYGVWIAVIVGMYPLCAWYLEFKRNKKDTWWVQYL